MILLTTLLVLGQTASPAPLENRGAVWGIVTATGHWSSTTRARWYVEAQPRFDTTAASFSAIILRGAAGFDVGAGFSAWLGFGWAPSFIPAFRNELRPFAQVLGEHSFGAFRLINRFRFEDRFLQDAGGMSLRVRHMVRGVYRLGESNFALAAYDELFVNLNTVGNGPAQGLDQNRAFIGANRTFGSFTVLEAGYLAAYVWRTQGPRLVHTAVIWLAFNFG